MDIKVKNIKKENSLLRFIKEIILSPIKEYENERKRYIRTFYKIKQIMYNKHSEVIIMSDKLIKVVAIVMLIATLLSILSVIIFV